MSRALIELCAGSAALSLHLSGHTNLMPYMGGKARYAEHLAEYCDGVDRFELYDIGPWGDAWRVLPKRHAEVCDAVDEMVFSGEDVEEMWQRLRTTPAPDDEVERVAVFLVLQRLAFGSKAVREIDGGWSNNGIQRTAAYGRKNTSGKFGDVKPQLPTLSKRLRSLSGFGPAGERRDARAVPPRAGCVVLLDPWYVGTTGYGPDDLTRDETYRLAHAWSDAGSDVLLTEAEPLGIASYPLRRKGRKRKWSDVTDWLTVFPAKGGA